MNEPSATDRENHLFPVFLKLHELRLLLVGAGAVGLEKLEALLTNSPEAHIHIVAKEVSEAVRRRAEGHPNLSIEAAAFTPAHLEGIDVLICAIDDPTESERIRSISKRAGILSNFADKPDFCDFYLGSVVRKGHLKIGISTNGKSPTLAKRVKEILHDALPDEVEEIIEHLSAIRSTVVGDISEKIKVLNEATRTYRHQRDKKKRTVMMRLRGIFGVISILWLLSMGTDPSLPFGKSESLKPVEISLSQSQP